MIAPMYSRCCSGVQDSFNETPTEAPGSEELPAHLQNVSPDTPVMMYCTGGIRCDIYSAYLRKKVAFWSKPYLPAGRQTWLHAPSKQS